MSSAAGKIYECAVIGGGPAGAAAAFFLARNGRGTVILEKSKGAHNKVCGEFLSYEAEAFLKEMGIRVPEECPRIGEFSLSSPYHQCRSTLPFAGRGISRFLLDEMLLSRAASAGADIRRGIFVTGFARKRDGLFEIMTNRGSLSARAVFVATGKQDLSRMVVRRGGDDGYAGFKFYLKVKSGALNADFHRVALFTYPGGYGGICPVENGRINFCFLLRKSLLKQAGTAFENFSGYLSRSNNVLREFFEQTQIDSEILSIGRIPYGYQRSDPWRRNVYYLGDQCAVIPSLTGDGTAIALLTGKQAAQDYARGKENTGRLFSHLRRQVRWGCRLHRLFQRPALLNAVIRAAQKYPPVIAFFFHRTRCRI